MFTRLQLAEIVEGISNVTGQRTLVNQALQMALNRVYEFFDFSYYLQDKGVIKTTDDYTTGTASVTNGSTTVTGSGTTWASSMVGRKFRYEGESAYYRISSVTNTTTIVLEQPYQGATDTGGTYAIYQDEYRLSADVDKYKIMRQAQNGITLLSLHPTRFDEAHAMPNAYGDPYFEIMEGTLLDTYSTGTVSAGISTSILNGSSTSWTEVEGLSRLSPIRVGNSVYTVKSVDSDTQITVYETLPTIASSSNYEITLNNIRVQVFNIPNAQKLLYFRYFRKPAPLANNYDLPDMPFGFHWILSYGALSFIFMHKGDMEKSQLQAEARFIDGLNLMKLKLGSFTPDRVYTRKSIDRMKTSKGFLDGVEAPGFDRRFSM